MRNIALILGGGSGSRMNQEIPKQFLTINDCPIIIYTLAAFQNHPEIDEIAVVCIDGWESVLKAYAKQYGITKLKYVFNGGNTVQESIRNGVFELGTQGGCTDDDIVIIHDGIRPIVDIDVLSSVIATCKKYGNGVTSLPYNEQIFRKKDELSTTEYIVRDTLRRVQTPQAYKFGKLLWAYTEAFEKGIGIHGSSYTNTMMTELGVRLFFAAGSDRNIKLTTPGDIEIFKAMLG